MPSEKKCPFTFLQTFSFRPEIRVAESLDSEPGKALESALKAISGAAGCNSTHWTEKRPDGNSIFVITSWSCQNDQVEFFASETWMFVLNDLQNYLLPSSPSSTRPRAGTSEIGFPESRGFGCLRYEHTHEEHEILTFKFLANATAENISEFSSRARNLYDGLFNVIETVDPRKPRLRDFSGGWVHRNDQRESASRTYVLFLSWVDAGQKEKFKSEDVDWNHFWKKVEGVFEGVETEQFSGRLKTFPSLESQIDEMEDEED